MSLGGTGSVLHNFLHVIQVLCLSLRWTGIVLHVDMSD